MVFLQSYYYAKESYFILFNEDVKNLSKKSFENKSAEHKEFFFEYRDEVLVAREMFSELDENE